MNQIIFIIIGICGFLLGLYFGMSRGRRRSAKQGLIAEQVDAKSENKRKIIEYIREQGKVKNDDIENLLGVSEATVTRYFDDLEKEGKVRQVGETGHAVYYELI
mgnify:FL=1